MGPVTAGAVLAALGFAVLDRGVMAACPQAAASPNAEAAGADRTRAANFRNCDPSLLRGEARFRSSVEMWPRWCRFGRVPTSLWWGQSHCLYMSSGAPASCSASLRTRARSRCPRWGPAQEHPGRRRCATSPPPTTSAVSLHYLTLTGKTHGSSGDECVTPGGSYGSRADPNLRRAAA